jgi:endo-1,3(4)-beta-glucanase
MMKALVSIAAFLLSSSLLLGAPAKITKDDVLKVMASSETQGNTAAYIFDGDPNTRWESSWQTDPSWISIELKDKKSVEAIKIKWENSAGSTYKIESSKDGKKWEEIARVEDGKGGESRVIQFKGPVNTKFLRVFGEQRTRLENGYSIWEVELNPLVLPDKDKLPFKSVEASSEQKQEGFDFSAKLAIDGDMSTRWSSEFSDPQWIKVELNNAAEIKYVKINWEAGSAKSYKIQISEDGSTWKEAASISDGAPNEERVITLKPVKAKFVRIYGEQRNGEWGYSIFEIGVYK